METMILVAGLAVAGLVGIAAAFYFSIRSGHGGDKRLRAAAAGRARTDRRPGSRSSGPARPDRTDNARRMSNAGRSLNAGRAPNAASRNYRAQTSTGPNPVPEFGDPAPAGSHRRADSRAGGRSGERAAVRRLGDRPEPQDDAWPDEPDRPRRRVGFRKGADLDEELWPAEAFGGVSDEQFWDDLASDKPLTTTARTPTHLPSPLQPDPGTRRRLPDVAPAAERQPPRANAEDRGRTEERSVGEARRAAGYGAYPQSRTGPNPAAERTAVQPAYAATQPVQVQPATQPVRPATQPVRPTTQPAETRGHRRRSAEEDPLTSSAFALRASGPVDGRSALRSRDESAGGDTSPYPYPAGSHDDASAVTQATNTPPYGANYGYGGRSPAGRGSDPRQADGTRNQAPHYGRPATGSSQGNGSYPTGGYRGNGHRAPYDPRDDYRRLTHPR
jgi:hypothetical protein